MITVYSKKFCPYCVRLLSLLENTDLTYEVLDATDPEINKQMQSLSSEAGVPQVRVGNIIMPDYGTEETLIDDIRWLLGNPDIDLENIQNNTTSKIITC